MAQNSQRRQRAPVNKVTTSFRVSDRLWAALQRLLPKHKNTHRFGGGKPRTPDRQCADAIFYEEVRATLAVFGFTAYIRARGEEAHALKRQAGVKARRWVVERAHSWLTRFRRIFIRREKKADNYLGFLHFACALMAFRAAGLFG